MSSGVLDMNGPNYFRNAGAFLGSLDLSGPSGSSSGISDRSVDPYLVNNIWQQSSTSLQQSFQPLQQSVNANLDLYAGPAQPPQRYVHMSDVHLNRPPGACQFSQSAVTDSPTPFARVNDFEHSVSGFHGTDIDHTPESSHYNGDDMDEFLASWEARNARLRANLMGPSVSHHHGGPWLGSGLNYSSEMQQQGPGVGPAPPTTTPGFESGLGLSHGTDFDDSLGMQHHGYGVGPSNPLPAYPPPAPIGQSQGPYFGNVSGMQQQSSNVAQAPPLDTAEFYAHIGLSHGTGFDNSSGMQQQNGGVSLAPLQPAVAPVGPIDGSHGTTPGSGSENGQGSAGNGTPPTEDEIRLEELRTKNEEAGERLEGIKRRKAQLSEEEYDRLYKPHRREYKLANQRYNRQKKRMGIK